jgi:hypothetical protein
MNRLEEIVKKQLNNLFEAKEAKGKISKLIDEFSEIQEQIDKLESEIKKLKATPKYPELKEKVSEIMMELKATGEDTMETKRFVLKVTRSGGESESTKYAEILKEFLPKVSIKLRETYTKLKESHTSITKRSPSLDIRKKEEVKETSGSKPSLSGVLSNIKTVRSMMNRLKAKFN